MLLRTSPIDFPESHASLLSINLLPTYQQEWMPQMRDLRGWLQVNVSE